MIAVGSVVLSSTFLLSTTPLALTWPITRGRTRCEHPTAKGALMAIRIVRLGSARSAGEGTRIGTVRRPPRGVPKSEFASGNWYDVWLPLLAPTAELVKQALAATRAAQWGGFWKKYTKQLDEPAPTQMLMLLAALSHSANFSVGCYCEQEDHCHHSILRELLQQRGAKVLSSSTHVGAKFLDPPVVWRTG